MNPPSSSPWLTIVLFVAWLAFLYLAVRIFKLRFGPSEENADAGDSRIPNAAKAKGPRWLTILSVIGLLSLCFFLWWLAAVLGIDVYRYF